MKKYGLNAQRVKIINDNNVYIITFNNINALDNILAYLHYYNYMHDFALDYED